MQKIQTDDQVYAIRLTPDDFKEGLSFFTNDEDFLQVGSWNYPKGKKLAAHNHNTASRVVDRTQEVVMVISGRMLASVYNEEDILVEEVEVCNGEILVLLAGGHGYEIMEQGTRVLEIKNGPYLGPEIDRRRLMD
jgi:hypothetical protein